MSEIIQHNVVKREKGYMYFIDGQGNICRAVMGKKKKEVIQ